MGELSPGTLPVVKPAGERLDSWKEIAAYLHRDVTTVQRWEKREGMPVHRHLHDRMGSVYAFSSELDAWSQGRRQRLDEIEETDEVEPPLIIEADARPEANIGRARHGWWWGSDNTRPAHSHRPSGAGVTRPRRKSDRWPCCL